MKVCIIGAGFTGLAAAYELLKKGHTVTIFEKDREPGGLAIGYKEKEWEWSIEKHYHHWFTNDSSVLSLAREIEYPVIVKRPKTSVYYDNIIYQLDSPLSVLAFSPIPFSSRIRMAAILAFLKFNPFWKPLEKVVAASFLTRAMGKRAYQTIWEPQLINKFGSFASEISLAWFWARIKKRTPSLAYPEGGFLHFAQALTKKVEERRGAVLFQTEVISLESKDDKVFVTYKKNGIEKKDEFDRAIVTLPSIFFLKIAKNLPDSYVEKLKKLQGIGAINLVLRMKKPFLTDGTYWLSICEKDFPIMAIVDHSHFLGTKHYNNEHIVYLGKYIPHTHPYFSLTKKQLLEKYDPYLTKINSEYKKNLIDYEVFKAPFAQPIIPTEYSKIIPSLKTPLKHVYLANIQQVYPWDRGTNYAVELGQKVAEYIEKNE